MANTNLNKSEIIDSICAKVASGESLRSIFSKEDKLIDRSTFYDWILANKEYADRYARATEIRADILFDEILDIADDSDFDLYLTDDGKELVNREAIKRSALRVDARKWALSKMLPKKFGDKQAIDLNANVQSTNLTREEFLANLNKFDNEV